jgi:hypothetical protein
MLQRNKMPFCKESKDNPQNTRKYLQIIRLIREHLNNKKDNPNKNWTRYLNTHFSKEDIQMTNNHLKRFSASVTVRGIQIKDTKIPSHTHQAA